MSKYGLPKKTVEVENHVGHWKIGTGASRLVDEVRESRKIASRVHEILTAAKVPSTYFQDDTSKTKNENLKKLVDHHNKDDNGLVVSYHLNASTGTVQGGIGTEVLYANEKWKPLAEALSATIAKAGGFKNRGAKKNSGLYVLNGTKEPAILIETFFVNSHADVTMYNRNFEAICQAIANVLAEAVGKTLKPPTTANADNKELHERARAVIRKAMKDGTFTGDHKDLNNYTPEQLFEYVVRYGERVEKSK